VRTKRAEEIRASSACWQIGQGRVLEITFEGTYPPGALGNEPARKMIDFARKMIVAEKPGAVLYNLRQLNYVWGDAVVGLARPLVDSERKTILPACIYAEGGAAAALQALLPTFVVYEVELFQDRDAAIERLHERLGFVED
jgi:hypothetical protein